MNSFSEPIAIGGVGGSGTRVVADLLRHAGVFMGGDLNSESDTLTFTALFKFREALSMDDKSFADHYRAFRDYLDGSPQGVSAAICERVFSGERAGQHDEEWVRARLTNMESSQVRAPSTSVGWKEPNTHILLDRIIKLQPDLRYIHVLRHGLDMAVSGNQNQVRLWGGLIPGTQPDDSPCGSLRFWCAANERSLAIAAELGERHMIVDYDALCDDPEPIVRRILSFADLDVNDEFIHRQCRAIVPTTKGRSCRLPLDTYKSQDVEYVRSLGFRVEQLL